MQRTDFVSILGGQFLFQFKFDWQIKDAVKALGSKYDPQTQTWLLPVNHESAARVADFLETHESFLASDTAKDILAEKAPRRGSISQDGNGFSRPSNRIEVEGVDVEDQIQIPGLRPYQNEGVRYAAKTRRTFIADELGLGKTIQALAAIQHEEAYPAVIVCKNINKFNWERETEQWTDAEVDLVFGRKPYMFLTDVVIINYEILQYHVDSIRQLQPKALIIDESQYTKNGKASRTKAAKEVAQMIPHDGLVLLLTGTPIVNRPSEIISQLQIIDRLKSLGGWRRFVDNYIGWDYVPVRGSRQQRKIVDPHGAQHLTELNRKLRKLCYIRRLKSDVLQELPEMTRTVMEVELSNREEYEQVKENFLYAVRQSVAEQYGDLDSDDFQAILAEKIEKALSAEQLREAQELRRTTARGKLEATIEWVQDFLDQEGDQKMVLFAYHRDIQKALIDAFPNCVRLIGLQDMTARERYQEEQRFWNTDVQIAVASLEAAKEGLNLQCASQVAFIELGWTPAGMAQAEGRIHRMGQDRGTTSYWIIGQDSFDQKIQELLEAKEQVTSALTEG